VRGWTRRSSQRSAVTWTTAVAIASRRHIINNDGSNWRVRYDEAWGEGNGTDDSPSPAMHGAYSTDIRHRYRGGMWNKTPPPTELQIPATVTTLLRCVWWIILKNFSIYTSSACMLLVSLLQLSLMLLCGIAGILWLDAISARQQGPRCSCSSWRQESEHSNKRPWAASQEEVYNIVKIVDGTL